MDSRLFFKGWDDPRVYTLAGLQRRGFPPEAINTFCKNFGLKKESAFIDPEDLHNNIREHLKETAPRYESIFKVVFCSFSSPFHLWGGDFGAFGEEKQKNTN